MKKTPLGEIRTMADDLLAAEGKQPVLEVEEGSPKKDMDSVSPSNPPAKKDVPEQKTPHPEELSKLLPFEGEDKEGSGGIEKSTVPQAPEPIKPPQAPAPPPVAPPLENMAQIDGSSLEEEIFPKPGSPELKRETPKGININELSKPHEPAPPKPKTEEKTVPSPTPPSPPGKKPKKRPGLPSKNNKMLLLGLIGVVGILIVGGILYIWLSGGEESPSVDPIDNNQNGSPVEAVPPDAFFTPDFIRGVIVKDTTQSNLVRMLNLLPEQAQKPSADSLTYIPIQLQGVTVDGSKAKYLTASDFINGLNIQVPDGFFESVDSEFTLYLYQPGEEERIACQNNLVIEEDCFGPRLGMVFKKESGSETSMNELAENWKNVSSEANLELLTLNNLIVVPETISYSVEDYEGTSISFANLPMPSYNNLKLSTTSFDMVVIEDYIIFGTSKNSTLRVVDRLIEELY